MPHDHSDRTDRSGAPERAGHTRALKLTLVLIGGFMAVEVAGGLIAGSIALLADAAHMLSDAASLALALGAIWLAQKPATPQRSFGNQRAEILAALINGVALLAIAGWIVYEAAGRLSDPPEVLGGTVLVVAIAGLGVNLVAFRILHGTGGESLNVSAAMRHVLADLAGSVGVIVAALLILTTGWREADPIIAMLIAVLVAGSGLPIIRDAGRVLLEQAPSGIDAEQVGEAMARAEGVHEVHDLHIWSITSGFPALAAHVTVSEGQDCHACRRELERLLRDRFGIEHSTLQVEHIEPRGLLQVEGAE